MCQTSFLTNTDSLTLPLQIRPRDFCWASEGDVVPLTEYLEDLRVGFLWCTGPQ